MNLDLQIAAGIILAVVVLALAQCSVVLGGQALVSHSLGKLAPSLEVPSPPEIRPTRQPTQAGPDKPASERFEAEFRAWYRAPPECAGVNPDWPILVACKNHWIAKRREFMAHPIPPPRIFISVKPASTGA